MFNFGTFSDVNECKDTRLNDCEHKQMCVNTQGNFTCSCPKNYKGDGRNKGKGCIPTYKAFDQYVIGEFNSSIDHFIVMKLVGSLF